MVTRLLYVESLREWYKIAKFVEYFLAMETDKQFIDVHAARVNNLKNIDVRIPRDKLIVITGLSGSGKSSLAFDTLYAEGQRRYVESLSSYARQFLGRMKKPDCDYIHGLPPAIAIEQKVVSRNPRSTVGTTTEIYDYMRLLFARIGRTISPISGCEVKRHTVGDVLKCVASYGSGTRFYVLAPIYISEGRTIEQQLGIYIQQGYTRLDIDGDIVRIEDYISNGLMNRKSDGILYLLVDRLTVSTEPDVVSRTTDSVETAFFEGNGTCVLRFLPASIIHEFSVCFEADGIKFTEPNENLFAFNSPMGACPECEGYGKIVGISEELVIPDSTRSVYEGAVVCWRGEKMGEWRLNFCRWASKYDFPTFKPYMSLTQKEKDMLWHEGPFSIDSFFTMVRENQYKIQYRVMMSRYRGKTRCPVCHGSRLRKEATYVQIGGYSITDLIELQVEKLIEVFDNLMLTQQESVIAERLLKEIRNRLRYLSDVGLGYLTLSRGMNTLSGGESQRINLAKSLGSSLVGSMYVLDEPSIGLHSRDTERLISVMRALQEMGNTVVVVEHDEEIMRAADHLIDIGPEAGRGGGHVVFEGNINESKIDKGKSYTVDYLMGVRKIEKPLSRRAWTRSVIVKGARANNLRGIDAEFPLNVMTVVTGVSGSGKSTLVRDILYNAMKRQLDEVADRPGEFLSLEGDTNCIEIVDFIDQNPIGKSTRSNPVTYVKAYDEIRKLFATCAISKQMGWGANYFSFNTEGGRCEQCKGEGTVTVEMQFMSDLILTCDACHGKRFKAEVLEARFEGKCIHDILCMTVNAAIEFFGSFMDGKSEQVSLCRKIVKRLRPLQQVGLGYVTLGQSSSTLSGGENQRVKLAYYIGEEKAKPTMFIFDEPTTGLHFHDTHRLLEAFEALIARGHTVICIEHNLDVIASADWIIDLGPEAGNEGGNIVAIGTPEDIVKQNKGYTARYLARKFQ